MTREKTAAEVAYEQRVEAARKSPGWAKLSHRVRRCILGLAPMSCCGRMSGHARDCFLRRRSA